MSLSPASRQCRSCTWDMRLKCTHRPRYRLLQRDPSVKLTASHGCAIDEVTYAENRRLADAVRRLHWPRSWWCRCSRDVFDSKLPRSEEHTSELQSRQYL